MNQADLRKAAILVSVLDTASADALLEQMGPAAERVRAAVMQLDTVSEAEQKQVIQEFLGRGSASKNQNSEATDEVTWELPEPPTVASRTENSPETAAAFAFLADADPLPLSAQLQRETPQIAAVVLAHLPAAQAADVLQHLPTALATDILVRIANLDETNAEVLEDIERQLQVTLAPYIRTQKSRQHGAARVGAILSSLPHASRGVVESALGSRDHVLLAAGKSFDSKRPALRIAPATIQPNEEIDDRDEFAEGSDDGLVSFEPSDEVLTSAPKVTSVRNHPAASAPKFSDLASLTDADWQRLLQSADEELVLLAFAGAEPSLINRVLRGFSRKEADYWRKQFAHPGPVKIREIDAAQARLAQLAAELTGAGRLQWNSARSSLAAA